VAHLVQVPLPPGARVLIVRLSALGDIVHALPVLAALRRRYPEAHIDWLVEEAYAPILAMVPLLNRRIVVRARSDAATRTEVMFSRGSGYLRAARFLRRQRYDAALDLQGLIKSAVWARLSGARRVIGFDKAILREPHATSLYTETVPPAAMPHVIFKNLAVAAQLGAAAEGFELPLVAEPSSVVSRAVAELGGDGRYAVLNPGAAWPNKRWPWERFGALAAALLRRHGLRSLVTWGPIERELARQIAEASEGAARVAPPTTLEELAWLMRGAAVVIAGDTGPLHIAAAMGTPLVGLYGPTWPERNGPWDPADEVISRAAECRCHHKRRCRIGSPCIETITLDDVLAAAARRLSRGRPAA
jgi:lipopolysaccharide heptosyltransferase I